MKTGIVCEGGGMRGAYTAGVLQSFMEADFWADLLVGVSAGASNGSSYVSRQPGRGMRTNIDYAGDKRYLGLGNLLRTGSIFGMDFVFGELPERLDPFDFEGFAKSPVDYYLGATDIQTGEIAYFGKEHIRPGLTPMRASCSMPLLAKIVEYDGGQYLDGGVAAPIPIDKALAEGCDKLVVVLTRPRGYQKTPQSASLLYRLKYRKYPGLVRAMDERHLVYNRTLEEIARLEKEGRAVVVAPEADLPAGRLGKDKDALMATYTAGLGDGKKALAKLDNNP